MSLPVALTLGDPSGIGGEISLRAWSVLRDELPFFLIADLRHMTELAGRLGFTVRAISDPQDVFGQMKAGLPVLDHPLSAPVLLGQPDPANAPQVVAMIARGVDLVRSGVALALCTNPIHKRALQEGAGFAFPGHTEYLAHLSGAVHPVMMLASPALRVVPATIHMAISEVPKALTSRLLERTIRVTHRTLIDDFGIRAPRLAISGLNPHAGEGGAFGTEEITLIAPLLERLRLEGLHLIGPLSADTMFHAAARARYDAAVCMYHDQALIPLKTLDFAQGVNVTLGLDFVRTSPDHGTAFDIAADLSADPSSLIAALRLAQTMGATRAGRP